MVSAILLMLPVTEGIYNFRTDVKDDTFYEETGVGETETNVTLLEEVYDDDMSTIGVSSSESTDTPVVANYTSATRVVGITGLAESSTRTLTVSYDIDALGASGALDTFMDRIAWIWMLCVIALSPAAIASIFMNRE